MNVKDSDFVNWMRPSAVPRVAWKEGRTGKRWLAQWEPYRRLERPIAFHKVWTSWMWFDYDTWATSDSVLHGTVFFLNLPWKKTDIWDWHHVDVRGWKTVVGWGLQDWMPIAYSCKLLKRAKDFRPFECWKKSLGETFEVSNDNWKKWVPLSFLNSNLVF